MTWTDSTVQSETWTNTTVQAESWSAATVHGETWTSEAPNLLRVFSPTVFSHATYNGLHVFSLGNQGVEAWYNVETDAEVWASA